MPFYVVEPADDERDTRDKQNNTKCGYGKVEDLTKNTVIVKKSDKKQNSKSEDIKYQKQAEFFPICPSAENCHI